MVAGACGAGPGVTLLAKDPQGARREREARGGVRVPPDVSRPWPCSGTWARGGPRRSLRHRKPACRNASSCQARGPFTGGNEVSVAMTSPCRHTIGPHLDVGAPATFEGRGRVGCCRPSVSPDASRPSLCSASQHEGCAAAGRFGLAFGSLQRILDSFAPAAARLDGNIAGNATPVPRR